MNLQDLAADLRQYYPAIHTAVDRAAGFGLGDEVAVAGGVLVQ